MPYEDRDDKLVPTPGPEQPGTLGEQMNAIATSISLAEGRGTPAREQWCEARSQTIPHARRDWWARLREQKADP